MDKASKPKRLKQIVVECICYIFMITSVIVLLALIQQGNYGWAIPAFFLNMITIGLYDNAIINTWKENNL